MGRYWRNSRSPLSKIRRLERKQSAMNKYLSLKRICQQCPENLFQVDDEWFESCFDKRDCLLKEKIIAELCVRYALASEGRRSVYDALLRKWLGEKPEEEFVQWVKSSTSSDAVFTQTSAELRLIQAEIHRRFKEMREWDGYIPLCQDQHVFGRTDGGALVPFKIRKREAGESAVVDWRGREIPEWNAAMEKLFVDFPEFRDYGVQVFFNVDGGYSLVGESLQLPVLMAIWKCSGKLPQYPIQELIATGEIQSKKILPVEISQKETVVRKYFPNAFFLYPESSQEFLSGARNICFAIGTSCDEIYDRLCELMIKEGITSHKIAEIKSRLIDLENRVKRDYESRWDGVINELNAYIDALDPDARLEEYLMSLILKSVALCHQGATAEAEKCNQKARDFAKEQKLEAECLFLEICLLVLLTDGEDWKTIELLAPDLEADLNIAEQDSNPVYQDLRMRFYGTWGQAECYRIIAGDPSIDKKKALEHFRKALRYAGMLNSPKDIAQDANYRHLWYALFEPGSEEEREKYKRAHAVIQDIQDEKARKTNENFLCRQKGLAAYRRLLSSGDLCLEIRDVNAELLLHVGTIPYLYALSRKYGGALLAARGEWEKADTCFQEGVDGLKNEGKGLIAYIRMTIAVQAFQSLRQNEDWVKRAEAFRQLAFRIFAENDDFQSYESAAAWKAFLDGSSEEFPGLRYHY